MKISAGTNRGRIINITNLETTRETSDKVRQAIFNLIGQFFQGGMCLDLFAGSGSVGLEAYSRGIDYVYFNDLSAKAVKVIESNAKLLKMDGNYTIYNSDYLVCLDKLKNTKFDLIFLDPPYAMDNVDEIVNIISSNDMLTDNGYLVFEMHKDSVCGEVINNYSIYKNRSYGIKKIVIYRIGN